MSYLDVARAAITEYERNERNEITKRIRPAVAGDERNEFDERTPGATDEAERLKVRIISLVMAEPGTFDRAAFDALWARWEALQHERGTS